MCQMLYYFSIIGLSSLKQHKFISYSSEVLHRSHQAKI